MVELLFVQDARPRTKPIKSINNCKAQHVLILLYANLLNLFKLFKLTKAYDSVSAYVRTLKRNRPEAKRNRFN